MAHFVNSKKFIKPIVKTINVSDNLYQKIKAGDNNLEKIIKEENSKIRKELKTIKLDVKAHSSKIAKLEIGQEYLETKSYELQNKKIEAV